ncbi:hypothetical protein HPB47_027660 [Ixodes persulcatus]|uniref:Uncharacterized protein n=1 Tax=Ixodes persulcatus TaxID=34615 RepID=A0AC60PVB0_IXOPE|nr:hypothetical protein HPB47_027660 [Ixodes persulcatus]
MEGPGSSVVPGEGGQPSAGKRVLVVGVSSGARVVEGVLSKVIQDKMVRVEVQPGKYLLDANAKAEEVLWDKMEGENLELIHAGLNDVLNGRRQNLGKQIEAGLGKLRAVNEGVHAEICTIPRVRGQSLDIERFLVKFLRSRKFRVQDTFQVIRNYFHVRTEHKDMFEDLLPSHILFDEVIRKNELFIILTECDAQGRRIVILKLGAWNPGICTLQEFFRAAFVALEYHLLDERLQIAGIVVVVDAGGYSLAHVRHYTPFEIRKLIKLAQVASAAQKVLLPPAGGARSARRRRGLGALLRRAMKTLSSRRLCSKDAASLYTDCYPLRIRGIYIVNHPPIFELFYSVAKLFLSRKLVKRVRFIGRRYKELHELLSLEGLPQEYGGSINSFDCNALEKALRSKQDFYVQLSQYGYKK